MPTDHGFILKLSCADRPGGEDRAVGVELHSFGHQERADGKGRVEATGDPDHHDMVDGTGRQGPTRRFAGQRGPHAGHEGPDPPPPGHPGVGEHRVRRRGGAEPESLHDGLEFRLHRCQDSYPFGRLAHAVIMPDPSVAWAVRPQREERPCRAPRRSGLGNGTP